jgi:hypothetical protein
MSPYKFVAIAVALLATQTANAGNPASLGTSVALPLLEGGLLTVAAAALVVGVRIVRAKSKR